MDIANTNRRRFPNGANEPTIFDILRGDPECLEFYQPSSAREEKAESGIDSSRGGGQKTVGSGASSTEDNKRKLAEMTDITSSRTGCKAGAGEQTDLGIRSDWKIKVETNCYQFENGKEKQKSPENVVITIVDETNDADLSPSFVVPLLSNTETKAVEKMNKSVDNAITEYVEVFLKSGSPKEIKTGIEACLKDINLKRFDMKFREISKRDHATQCGVADKKVMKKSKKKAEKKILLAYDRGHSDGQHAVNCASFDEGYKLAQNESAARIAELQIEIETMGNCQSNCDSESHFRATTSSTPNSNNNSEVHDGEKGRREQIVNEFIQVANK